MTGQTHYHVGYTIDKPRYATDMRVTEVTLSEGYSAFEDIRKIISIRQGCTVEEIKIHSVMILPE